MSMYDMLFQQNPLAAILLKILDNPNVGRYRDAWVEKDAEGKLRIAVYTRNGGGNREHYNYNDDEIIEEGIGCACTGCIITYGLPSHPLYIEDRDDDFDCTYATVYFRLPDDAPANVIEALKSVAEDGKVDTSQRWLDAIEALKQATPKK